jgi:hypothetical protein
MLAQIRAAITRPGSLNPPRRHRTCPRAIKRSRHNSYRVKQPSDRNIRYPGPATIQLRSRKTPARSMINLS